MMCNGCDKKNGVKAGVKSKHNYCSHETKKINERMRSKENRAQFRNLLNNLNDFIHSEKLNTNKCLAMASAVLKLQKYLSTSKISHILEIANRENCETDEIDVVGIDPEIVNKNQSDAFIEQSRILNDLFPLHFVLDALNFVGLAFDQNGKILYTSENFMKIFGLAEPIVGDDLKTLILNSSEVLNCVFEKEETKFVAVFEINKICGNETTNTTCQGRILSNEEGTSKLFLGYIEAKQSLIANPMGYFWHKEVMINDRMEQLSRHIYIDLLLGYDEYTSSCLEHLHHDDFTNIPLLADQIKKHGYIEGTFRLLCNSATNGPCKYLCVFTRVIEHKESDGRTLYRTYSWPFAFTVDTDDLTSENLIFISNSDYCKLPRALKQLAGY